MHKSENTILIWVLTWAGLLLGLLYSPIGSPDLYKHRNYFVENQGVNFSGVEISRGSNEVSFLKVLKNATKSSSSYQDENADLNIPVVNDVQRRKFNYTVSGSSKSENKYVSGIKIPANTYRSIHSIKESDKSFSNSGNSGGGNDGGLSNTFTSSKSSRNNGDSQNAGVNTAGVDLSLFGDSTANQINKNIQKAGMLDELSANLVDEPVPVPEGFGFLVLMAAIYCGYILFKKSIIHSKVL